MTPGEHTIRVRRQGCESRIRTPNMCNFSPSQKISLRNTIHHTPHTVHSAPYTMHRTPYTIHRTTFTIHRTTFTIHRTPYTVHRTTFTIHRTPYTIHHALYTVVRLRPQNMYNYSPGLKISPKSTIPARQGTVCVHERERARESESETASKSVRRARGLLSAWYKRSAQV